MDAQETPLAVAGPPLPVPGGISQRLESETDTLAREHGAASQPGQSQPGPATPPLESPRPFDEGGTKAGITLVVELANQGAIEHFTAKAKPIVGEGSASRFGNGAAMSPQLRDSTIASAVEVCRKNSLNLGPEMNLAAALIYWAYSLNKLSAELVSLAKSKPPEKKVEPTA